LRSPSLHLSHSLFRCLPVVALVGTAISGCGKKEAPPAPKPAGPPTISDADLQKHKPNEAGAVMVVMYHRILADERDNDLNRKPDTFRKDLETLYKRGYHPVTALEFVENKMDVPLGKTPVVITFDDALESQFKLVEDSGGGQPKISRDCAVGILETFSKEHPDWPRKATFFVLPKEGKNSEPFGQAEYVTEKLQFLQKHGYEIANHTSTHTSMRGMSPTKIRWELATAVRDIQAIVPEAPMETLALPYGNVPRSSKKEEWKSLESGEDGGTKYRNKAVFQAAWRPNHSPLTVADRKLVPSGTFCIFKPMELERITPDASKPNSPGTFEYWLKQFEKNRSQRYISDGIMEIATVPIGLKSAVDTDRAKAQGKTLKFYGGASGGGGKNDKGGNAGGGDLSVE